MHGFVEAPKDPSNRFLGWLKFFWSETDDFVP